jgi:hypothetical protein
MRTRFKYDRFLALIRNRYFIVTFIFIVWILFFDNNSLTGWVRALGEYSKTNPNKDTIKKRYIKQKEICVNYNQQRFPGEIRTRKNYFHKSNEDVFIITPGPSNHEGLFPYK